MAWFDGLKQALPDYYNATGLPNVVGYLRGSVDPNVWRSMEQRSRHQMMILGSKPPTNEDWVAAGVAGRGADQTVTVSNLIGFIVLYGGFMRRPWGKIYVLDPDTLKSFPNQILSWKRNHRPPMA